MKRNALSRSLILIISAASVYSSAAFAAPKVYFNQNESTTYTEPYRNFTRHGDNLEKVILEEVYSAKSSIYLAVQEFRLPLVAKALVQKAKEGVDVRVILENTYNNTVEELGRAETFSNFSQDDTNSHESSKFKDLFAFVDVNKNGALEPSEISQKDAVAILRENNIPIIDDTFDGSRGSGLMHHKFMVVDTKRTIVTSANFTPSGVHGDELSIHSRGNSNGLMKVNSIRMARIFETEFFYMWGGKDGRGPHLFGVNKPYRGRQTVKLKDTTFTIQFSPTSRWKTWEESVNGLIGETLMKAKKSVHMALFVFSEQRLADILEERTKLHSNMDLKLLIEPNFAYRQYSELLDVWGLSLKNERCEEKEGNNPWATPYMTAGAAGREDGDVFHHKFAVVDAKTVIFGSQNWSESANRINEETLVVIENKDIAQAFEKEYMRAYKKSFIGPPKTLLKKIEELNELCGQF